MSTVFTRAERDANVNEYWKSEARTTTPNVDQLTDQQAREEYAKQSALLAEYGERLPRIRVSRCPFSGEPLEYAFDAFGLDGMWWASEGIVDSPIPDDPHFMVLLGAIDFHGREPIEAVANGQVLPGPGVPFVVPRLLELPGMMVVVSTLDLPHGDSAYLMAYFSDTPTSQSDLHQPWARETFLIHDDDGDDGWAIATDRLDFELQKWIEKGRVRWIKPGDQSLTIQQTGACPYVGLPGLRAPQSIDQGKLSTLDLPTGGAAEPFD